jgi:hypothetical protein
VGLRTESLRFIGKENTVDLQETALVVEGNLLKAGLLGIELLFRRALADWSAVTIPYSRITAVRYVRFPLLRLAALAFLVVLFAVPTALAFLNPDVLLDIALVDFGLFLLALYVSIRVPARYAIRFRARDGRRAKLMLQVKSKKLRAEFARRLADNREAAARFADRAGPAGGPDPLAAPRARTPVWLVVFVVLFLLAAAAVVPVLAGLVSDVLDRPGGVYRPPTAVGGGIPSAGPPAPKAAAKAAPVADINPETIKAGLVGQSFTFQSGPGPISKRWRIEPGEIKELEVLDTETVGDILRTVHVRVGLEGTRQRLRGTLTVMYIRQGNGWVLGVVTPKAGADFKPLPMELTDLE